MIGGCTVTWTLGATCFSPSMMQTSSAFSAVGPLPVMYVASRVSLASRIALQVVAFTWLKVSV